jgi:4-hydroxy-3-methylbut-2-enyl diphosphate reductase
MSAAAPPTAVVLAFDASNRLAVRQTGDGVGLAFVGDTPDLANASLERAFAAHTPPAEQFAADVQGRGHRVYFTQVPEPPADPQIVLRPLDELAARPAALSVPLARLLEELTPHLVDIPYLHLGENDFIYKFRPAPERNAAIYAQDAAASALYQSRLCAAIKALARQHERTAAAPVTLDFGAVRHIIPSHFGFCLGVRNAIERAYETLAENPGRRVFMLSELIHNPFVNGDLLRRGLRYLQTDKGVPYYADGSTDGNAAASSRATGVPPVGSANPGRDARATSALLWDTLTPADIVIIPAFGATDDDKGRLVRKGIAVCQYDATCMLVEKVWKAARAYGREGFTVIIHGKSEHEETKATFSNTRRYAPAVIVRNLDEVRALGELIASDDPAVRARFYPLFAGKHTPDFDVARHLERVAVVNQTTLLMNETLAIIEHLKSVYRAKYGEAAVPERVGGGARRDTLCYATQVNQDALSRALAEPLDAAFVIGGKNSSNTYQLFRLCEQRLGAKAFFIQNEANILSRESVEHYVYVGGGIGRTEARALWPVGPLAGRLGELARTTPKRVLVTGGASCPDGIIQQVITRLNSLFPPEQLRPIEAVLAGLEN